LGKEKLSGYWKGTKIGEGKIGEKGLLVTGTKNLTERKWE